MMDWCIYQEMAVARLDQCNSENHMPEWMMINCIEVDPFTKGGAYLVGTKYKTGDYRPYIYKTTDYGQTWRKITNGIGAMKTLREPCALIQSEKGSCMQVLNGVCTSVLMMELSWSTFQLNLTHCSGYRPGHQK